MLSLNDKIPKQLSTNHLLDIPSITKDDIGLIIQRARVHRDDLNNGIFHRKILDNKIIISLFAEPSTRTRVSFDMAAYRLGAKLIYWDEANSSVLKGETFSDTIDYLASYKPDAIIMRHKEYNAPYFVSTKVDCPVINGGDSYRAHPTQALLDAMTILDHKPSLENLTVAICGDVAHSRVAADNIALLSMMGARVNIIAPENLLPQKTKFNNVYFYTDLKEGLQNCDAVMGLRLQKERMDAAAIPDEISYYNAYALTQDTIKFAKPDAIVLHPGPMNRGVEISDDLADGSQSVILQQAVNSVPLRMAVLDLLLS
jgi:aspartate carbamoyltransferase catalytic subunit